MELRVFSELALVFSGAKHSSKVDGFEVDILMGNLKIGVEVDGYYWHKDSEKRDLTKTKALIASGIRLIRMREVPLRLLSCDDIGYVGRFDHIRIAIKKLVRKIGRITNIDVSWYLARHDFSNDNLYEKLVSQSSFPEKSIALVAPHLVDQWHPVKNGFVRPEHISFGSQLKFWWRCGKGHEWKAVVATRVNGHGCPFCYKENRVSKPR